jgi:hypothetical protein
VISSDFATVIAWAGSMGDAWTASGSEGWSVRRDRSLGGW